MASRRNVATGDPSLARGLRVLLAVADRRAVRVETLAKELGMPLSTVYRYMRVLREFRLVAEHEGVYTPGQRLVTLGSADDFSREALGHLARPVLRSLVERTGETALLTARVGRVALCLEQVESFQQMRMAFEVGQVLPLHAGAASRVLLAHAPPDVVEDVIASNLARFTANTPDPGKLRRQLDSIRATGFATSRAEFVNGALAIATSVFRGQTFVCALTVAGPELRCGRTWQVAAKEALHDAAAQFGRLLVEAS